MVFWLSSPTRQRRLRPSSPRVGPLTPPTGFLIVAVRQSGLARRYHPLNIVSLKTCRLKTCRLHLDTAHFRLNPTASQVSNATVGPVDNTRFAEFVLWAIPTALSPHVSEPQVHGLDFNIRDAYSSFGCLCLAFSSFHPDGNGWGACQSHRGTDASLKSMRGKTTKKHICRTSNFCVERRFGWRSHWFGTERSAHKCLPAYRWLSLSTLIPASTKP